MVGAHPGLVRGKPTAKCQGHIASLKNKLTDRGAIQNHSKRRLSEMETMAGDKGDISSSRNIIVVEVEAVVVELVAVVVIMYAF